MQDLEVRTESTRECIMSGSKETENTAGKKLKIRVGEAMRDTGPLQLIKKLSLITTKISKTVDKAAPRGLTSPLFLSIIDI